MQFYASIYALSMAVMLILKAIRGVVFVKVYQWVGRGIPLPKSCERLGVAFVCSWVAPMKSLGPC